MLKHKVFDIEWIGFPSKQKGALKGCYMIGDFYIGASSHIRNRIIAHCSNVYSITSKCFIKRNRFNVRLDVYDYIYNCMKNGLKIKVTLLSLDPFDEKSLIQKYNTNQSVVITYDRNYKKCKNGTIK